MSYSSMPKFASKINSYNKRILNENIGKSTSASCNCRIMASSPLDGNWLQSSLAYILAKIINDFPQYIGLTENTFKDSDDDKRIVLSRFSVSANLVCYTFCSMFTDTTSSIVLRCKPSSTTSKIRNLKFSTRGLFTFHCSLVTNLLSFPRQYLISFAFFLLFFNR